MGRDQRRYGANDVLRKDGFLQLPPSAWIALLCFLLSVLGFVLPLSATESMPRAVKTLVLTSDAVVTERVFFGRVAPARTIDVAFQVGGRVLELTAPEGEVIPAGTVIARLDQVPFRNGLERAEVNKGIAERRVARFQRLRGNSVAEATAEDAESELSLATVALSEAEYALAQSVLVAPFDVMVAERFIEKFSTVAAGTPVARVLDMSEVYIDVRVPEVFAQQVGSPENATVEVQFPTRNTRYSVTFREVNAIASELGQTFEVSFGMPAPEDLLLLPGNSAAVYVRVHDASEDLVVPPLAVRLSSEGTPSVFVFREGDGGARLTETTVELAAGNDGEVFVTSGLAPGDEIVVAGTHLLQDGQAVRRFTSVD